ncbi:hypothetical protein [Labrenzia sp. DG1229]|uniref:hypothetical protein n=1 Tax=Labrenzia sp. DG1229 TaxID=681847 RepID=UPI000B28605F|nr:hypothetical protein [Labrenzia sp. DG1229]
MRLTEKNLASSALLGLLSFASLSGFSLAETIGPNNESATPSSAVIVADDNVDAIRSGNYKAALLWHDQSDFVNAVTAGASDEFKRLGIEVVATASAGFVRCEATQ